MNTTANTTVEKFTPGPWFRKEQPALDYGYYIETVDQSHKNTFIGEVGGGLQDESEIEANAKLIVAAPEMYKALKKAAAWLGEQRVLTDAAQETGALDLHRTIEAAIKKAIE